MACKHKTLARAQGLLMPESPALSHGEYVKGEGRERSRAARSAIPSGKISEEERIIEYISVRLKIDHRDPMTPHSEYWGKDMPVNENISVSDSLMRKYPDDAEKSRSVIERFHGIKIKEAG